MKVKIQKLGCIHNTEFDLKPLTVLVGENDTGKTWLAYTLSAILGPYGEQAYREAYVTSQLPDTYLLLDDAIQQVLARGDAKIDLYSFAKNYGEQYFNNVASSAKQWMSSFMSTQYALFDDMNMSITLDKETKAAFLQRIKDCSLENIIANGLLKVKKKSGNNTLYVYTTADVENGGQRTEKLPAEALKKHVTARVIQVLHQALYPYVRVFPTERAAISAQKSIFANIPAFAFKEMLEEILGMGPAEIAKRQEAASNNPQIQKYCDLAEVLEENILLGNITFSTAEPDPSRNILFQPTQNLTLELANASSIVKELSSLALYLRYLAQPGELIIIDEPEMNLHPIAQVQITELLTALVNAGLHVLITTHSTYVLDHLGNLLKAYKYENKDEIVDLFQLERTDSFLDQKLLSVYEFTENGTIENILHQHGVDWETFNKVTTYVHQIYFKLWR